MTSRWINAALGKAGILACSLLLAGGAAMASSVTLVAGPTSTTLPDGQSVPMWGYTCGDATTTPAVLGTPVPSFDASCLASNGNPQTGSSWQPPVITVQSGKTLTINLVNSLSFGANAVPTSLVIVGQLGGGLGAAPQRMASPVHAPQGTTWPGTVGGTDVSAGDAVFTPPVQGDRVRSFGSEVAAGMAGNLVWNNLRPGTYLIESGTQPSIQGAMGLYGVLVVTEPATLTGALTAYGTTYDKDVPLLLSEIDPVQNAAVDLAVHTPGFVDTRVWSGLPNECGDPAVHSCYPPAVNYSPLYYLINGVAFDRTNTGASTVSVANGATQGKVLLRMVNAGLRMHVPNVVGAPMTLLAEDGNKLPGLARVQNSVFLAPGKTYDVVIKPAQLAATTATCSALPCYTDATYAIFDRQLSLSTANQRDGGMQAYIKLGDGASANAASGANANTALSVSNKTYYCSAGVPLVITDPSKGLLAGSVGANGVAATGYVGDVSATNLSLQANGTFSYTPTSTSTCGGSFTFAVNGLNTAAAKATATITQCDANVGDPSCLAAPPVASDVAFSSHIATRYTSTPPGVLGANVSNPGGLALKASVSGTPAGGTVTVNTDGSFQVSKSAGVACPAAPWVNAPGGSTCVTFDYQVKNTQGSASTAHAAVIFRPGSGLAVSVKDSKNGIAINDYRWIIEEDRTFWVDPKCQVNSIDPLVRPASCPPLPVESLGYNFHTASMPVIAQGCVGPVSCESGQTVQGAKATCDIGNGACRAIADNSGLGVQIDLNAGQKAALLPADVVLDPNKRYFISVLPGDGVNPTIGGSGGPDGSKPFSIKDACGDYNPADARWVAADPGAICGHEMGGAQVAPFATAVTINLQQTPLPTAKISVFVFQDDNPLNGENDAGGGVDVVAPNEAGLGGFEVKLFDQAGQLGDNTGQITYDMFNQPVSNSLAGFIDPVTNLDACPITVRKDGIVGMVPTCPKFEADGVTISPLAGQVVIANLYPGLYEIQAYPAADRIGKGEQWWQTNTLDGGKPHEAFIKPNEPGYFQEFGPGGFHVAIGFANPAIINARKAGYCASTLNPGGQCKSTLTVEVTNNHMSRTPDQRTYNTESYDHYSFTQCYVSIGPADGEDFAIQPCVFTTDGQNRTHATATFTDMPIGTFKMSVFDQWNDIMLDGLVGTVQVDGGANKKTFPVTQWRTNLYTRTFVDTDGTGVSDDSKPGLALVNTNIHYRDGSIAFFNNTDLSGYAGFNEIFPFMNWLVVETTQTRFKPTWVHSVYDAGGPVDCSAQSTADGMPCSTIAANLANTDARVPLPADLRVPGAKYCDSADCPPGDGLGGKSSGTLFPGQGFFGNTMGWQGLLGQNTFMEFGVKPFAPKENGGIHGNVVYASTRPFDDPALLLQLSWAPGVPRVKLNLYKKEVDASGNEKLTLADSTLSTSFDDWAQGFRRDASGNLMQKSDGSYIPNMNCPGQDAASPFFATLKNSKEYLDADRKPLAYNSQFKCYDGWSQLNQAQPAPYDGYYKFPSVKAINPATGKPSLSNCAICVANPDDGTPMLPAGKYVVEVVVPPGYELVKEEDKNILLGDVYIAPVAQQFAGFGNIFIMPDQASVNSAYNAKNPGGLNKTTGLGASPRHEGDTGSVEAFWPCVGAERIVPDLNSLFPQAGQAAPFAGAKRRLCDRKEVSLDDQSSVLAKFFVFSSTHIAGHFTGTITNDFASEFDPFSPQFGEKFGPPNLPVGIRDFNGNEVARVYSDQWGIYNGLYFSSWSVNPPNPTGYAPQMSIACMNDPGPINIGTAAAPNWVTDPAYNSAYSNFCYEQPFMPGTTTYMDTPVIPTQAFADGYNLPDTEYPDQTPAIKSVMSDTAQGPWVPIAGGQLTITALGDKVVQNPNFAGPNATTAPYNQKTITRHYGFGGAGTAVLVAPDEVTTVSLNLSSWSDTSITATVPTLSSAFNCKVQQQGAPISQCGQLVITRSDNDKKTIDAITVTAGGSAPWVVTPTAVTAPTGKSVQDYASNFGRMNLIAGASNQSPIQVAIDSAAPGDLILVQPGTYRENLIMWKPVRLQGVGATSVTINADAHPAGHMDQWRRQMVCAFGLTLQGIPNLGNSQAKFDPTGQYSCPDAMFLKGDRIPFEAITGWDAAGNGNLAQVLQEPTLLGAYEGAGVTVVGRGVRVPAGSTDFWGADPTVAGAFAVGSVYLSNNTADCAASATRVDGMDYSTSNYKCNPARIDGVSILNSSQGGGGLFVHGWGHNLEVANTRISSNHGTLAGAINLGNGETPPVFLNDGTSCGVGTTALCPPIPPGTPTGAAIPFGFNTNVRIHHNMLYNNASIGDALFTGTPAGAGGVTVSAGGDNYQIDHNWIAGNLSTGDGGGVQILGVNFDGKISNNVILFNQSTNPTLPTNGGGIVVQGANEPRTLAGTECGGATDTDCPPGLGDGTGARLVIDGNLIYGNSAESGTGGGIALEMINGSELIVFPNTPNNWYGVELTNNIIANNVAGYDGGGISMRDALKLSFINNTVVSNDTTASAGVLFKTLGAINSSSPPPGCNAQTDPTLPQNTSCLGKDAPHGPQPSGLVTMAHTQNLNDAIGALVVTGSTPRLTCPAGFGYANGTGTGSLNNGDCIKLSKPALVNDLFWQNRTFHVDLATANGGKGTGLQSQQNLVVITPQLTQTTTGECSAGAQFWDIGLRTDDVQALLIARGTNSLTITNSILTGTGDISNLAEIIASPTNMVGGANPVIAQVCNGARVPPEYCGAADVTGGQNGAASCKGFNAPPGASESTSTSPLFVFNGIQPTATVDEGHNWLNLVYGPLTLNRTDVGQSSSPAELMVASAATGTTGGAYSIALASPAVDAGANVAGAPDHDFFGNPRPSGNGFDIGAVEFPKLSLSPASFSFGSQPVLTSVSTNFTLRNPSAGTLASIGAITLPASNAGDYALVSACGASLAPGASCAITVTFTPQLLRTTTATLTVNAGAQGTLTAAITGTGSGPLFSVTPGSLQFPNTVVATTSAAKSVTVRNNQITAMPFTTVGLNGLFGGQYAIAAGTTCLTGAANALASGASCVINVTFNPQSVGGLGGIRPANLQLTASALTNNVGLNGTAILFPVDVTPKGIFGTNGALGLFPSTQVGQFSVQQVATLSNYQSTAVTLTSITMPSQFSIVSGALTTCTNGAVLSAAASDGTPTTCTVAIQFAPNAVNTFFGAPIPWFQSATFNLVGSPVNPTVSLTGTAVNSAISGGPAAFGNQQVGTTSASRVFTFTNSGATAITVNNTGVTLTGTNAGNYAIVSNTCVIAGVGQTLVAGTGACTVGVTFTPNATGSRTATLTVADATGSQTVGLSGTGTQGTVAFTATSLAGTALSGTTTRTLAFGDRTGSVTTTVTLTNSGTLPVTYGTATVTNGTGTAFSKTLPVTTDTCSGTTRAVGVTCQISVTFVGPAGTSNQTGTLSVPTVAPNSATNNPAVLNLTGS